MTLCYDGRTRVLIQHSSLDASEAPSALRALGDLSADKLVSRRCPTLLRSCRSPIPRLAGISDPL